MEQKNTITMSKTALKICLNIKEMSYWILGNGYLSSAPSIEGFEDLKGIE